MINQTNLKKFGLALANSLVAFFTLYSLSHSLIKSFLGFAASFLILAEPPLFIYKSLISIFSLSAALAFLSSSTLDNKFAKIAFLFMILLTIRVIFDLFFQDSNEK